MKQHAIIPIFIPHCGCPHDCVFCDQKKITARTAPPTPADAAETIETWLSTLRPRGVPMIEIAFFGGSFTGIPAEQQTAFLTVAKRYKDAGLVQRLRLSTRPDYIDEAVLDRLDAFGVDTVELGVQSFDDEVLRRAARGHDSAVVYRSCRQIRDRGFALGIQLMIGLPGDTAEKDLYAADETVKLHPAMVRLYPTVLLRGTALYTQFLQGQYTPLTQAEAVTRTAAMYRRITAAGIPIIRVGLKSSEILTDPAEADAGTFHPAFRQLVTGALAREDVEAQLTQAGVTEARPQQGDAPARILCTANRHSFSSLIGHAGENKRYFREAYPALRFTYRVDDTLPDEQYRVTCEPASPAEPAHAACTPLSQRRNRHE